MNDETLSTAPKPFVFVLMPFNEDFDDIYKLGIKEAAKEVGAYAERVDEQIFNEGILERIFNQISKADVIVADMTGRNPNVFYEVGYAHALGKIVLLLTQKADDIPFDLKHKQHIIYGNGGSKIQSLRSELNPKLNWAINESRRKRKEDYSKIISIYIHTIGASELNNLIEIPENCLSKPIPTVRPIPTVNPLSNILEGCHAIFFQLHNISSQEIPNITHIYLFTEYSYVISLIGCDPSYCIETYSTNINDKFKVKYRIPVTIPSIPADAVETFGVRIPIKDKVQNFMLRIHISNNCYDFSFKSSIS